MKTKPYFSIITPTYNRAYTLWKTIQSVQRQSFTDWEYFVVDDGSTDDTAKLMSQLTDDSRIHYIQTENTGAPHARNVGLDHAQGEIITYIDSDDIVYEHYLSFACDFFKKYPDKQFGTSNSNRRTELYDAEGRLIDFTMSSSAQKDKVALTDIIHWEVKNGSAGIFHRKGLAEKGLRWDESLKRLQDLDLTFQMGTLSPDGYLHIPLALFEYTQRHGLDSVVSETGYKDWGDAFQIIYDKWKDSPLLTKPNIYTDKIAKYYERQKQFEAGELPPIMYRYFPAHYRK